ncbi:MAG TPA: alpha/beta fold hydrolase [Stellaceae bacterium]|jgi:polyhydroxyalkanoate synthase
MLDAIGLAPVETPSRLVAAFHGADLIAFHPADATPAASGGPALLIVPAPIKRHYIWDLAPDASAVRRCLAAGLRVFLVRWRELDPGEAPLGLTEVVERLLPACADAIRAETGEVTLAVAGHSLGGTLATVFAAAHPSRVRRLLLIESPLSFGAASGALTQIAEEKPDKGNGSAGVARDEAGNVPGSFLNAVSLAASPEEFQWSRWADFVASLFDPPAMLTHLRVQRWTLDEFAMPGRLFDDVLGLLYRGDAFARGSLVLNGRVLGPGALTMPVMAVVDPRSSIIPPAAMLPVIEAAPCGGDKRLLWYEGDRGVALQHVGALVGPNAHSLLWPQILDWLAAAPSATSSRGRRRQQ